MISLFLSSTAKISKSADTVKLNFVLGIEYFHKLRVKYCMYVKKYKQEISDFRN